MKRNAVLPLAALALLAACHLHPPAPTASLDRAASKAQEGSADPRTLALAGYQAYLVQSDAKKAQTWFDAALKQDPAEPYALYGELILARRAGHPERAIAAALDLCEKSPRHPLASAAARYVLDLAGTAVSLDDAIFDRAPKALAAGAGGDAAHLLRSAIGTIQGQRGDAAGESATLAAMGDPELFTVVGPFSPFHVLSFDEALPSEESGSLAGPFPSPYGALSGRELHFPDGRLSLAGESPREDIYLAAVDFDVREEAVYVVRVVTAMSEKTFLDGTLLFQRRDFERTSSTVNSQAVRLDPGTHRILVKIAKAEHAATLSLSVLRGDGQPAQLTFKPARGPAPQWNGATLRKAEGVYPNAQDFADALSDEVGELLGDYLAARDGMGRDRDGTKPLIAKLGEALTGPAFTSLRADLSLQDRTVPGKVAHGRATRDLEATIAKDPGDVVALLERATLALDDGRTLEAADVVKQARAAHQPVGFPVALLQARVELALGVDAQAERSAQESLRIQPGLCDANVLRYDLARRRDATQLADQLVQDLAQCPGALSRAAEHQKTRGDNAKAIALYEQLLARDPSHVPTALALSNLYVAEKRYPDAAKLFEGLARIWPRSPPVLKRWAEIDEFAGKPKEALALREQALLIDGSDVALRRIVERAKTGKEPLAEYAVSSKSAIAAYEAERGDEDAQSAYVLDFGAMRAYPDGSMLDRIHVIQKALDQNGVSEIAEVQIPPGAQVLTLRTVKADGSVLEPENIEDKETVSLPGVQVGDYIDYEFLQGHPSRGPAEPGWTASNFYFQVARSPNNWSTYTVIGPKGGGMKVDAHNMTSEAPKTQGDLEVYFHAERRVPPFIPEPNSPPSANEFLPWVAVGAGQTGQDGLMRSYGDGYIDRGQLTYEVVEFAKNAAAGKTGLEAVKAIDAAVMARLQGRDSGLTESAASSLAEDRGSRLWALKASLAAVGIKARLAAIRTFAADPAQYLFPSDQLYPYVAIRVELPDGQIVWLDPLIRFGPFGELPEQALGERDAYLLPEPGLPLEKVKTPPARHEPGKNVKLTLALAADGKLSGRGEETYTGFDAAQLSEALDQLSPDQRDQALQSALSRYFGGAELSSVKLDLKREVGAPLTVRYDFTAPRYARVDGNRIILGPLTFPASLGRRFVQVGSRRTPLFIEGSEHTHTVATLDLPPGYVLSQPMGEVKAGGGPYGAFWRHEKQAGNQVQVEEDFLLQMARIPVNKYDEFTTFAGDVDLIQTRDLIVEKK